MRLKEFSCVESWSRPGILWKNPIVFCKNAACNKHKQTDIILVSESTARIDKYAKKCIIISVVITNKNLQK